MASKPNPEDPKQVAANKQFSLAFKDEQDPDLAVDELDAIGTSGLRHTGGRIFEEFHRALRGRQKFRTLAEMRNNHATVGAILHVTEMIVRQVEWEADPPDPEMVTSEDEVEQSMFLLKSGMGDMSMTWEDILTEILSCPVHGWAFMEVTYKTREGPDPQPVTGEPDEDLGARRSQYDDGLVAWRKIELRAQKTLDSWAIERDGGIRGMWQRDPNGGGRVFIPIEKAILFRTQRTMNNPEGRSWLRNALVDWFYSKTLDELEVIGAERDMAGIPLANVPPAVMNPKATGQAAAIRRAIKTQMEQLRRNEHAYVMFPSEENPDGSKTGYKIGLMTTGGRRQHDTTKMIGRHDRNIATTVGAQFLFLGRDGVGSNALSNDQTDVYLMTLKALLDIIEETFHRFGTMKLMAMNGIRPENMARWKHRGINKQAAEKLITMLKEAVNAGIVTPDDTLERHVRERAGAPMPEEDLDLDQSEDASDENLGRLDVGLPDQEEVDEATADPDPADDSDDDDDDQRQR